MYAVRLGFGDVLLSDEDFRVDRKTLEFIVTDRAWATDYTGALVLDIGAHKGYFGAYALGQGAQSVVSFEPEAANLELLERTAAAFREKGADWTVRPVAVGAARTEAELHVMAASWGHSLHPPDSFAEYEVGVQRVAVEPLADVLAEAAALADRARVVVKVNIEGAECSTVLETPANAWRGVSEVFVETHPWAPCGAAELAAHLAPGGLTRARSAHRMVLRLRASPTPA